MLNSQQLFCLLRLSAHFSLLSVYIEPARGLVLIIIIANTAAYLHVLYSRTTLWGITAWVTSRVY